MGKLNYTTEKINELLANANQLTMERVSQAAVIPLGPFHTLVNVKLRQTINIVIPDSGKPGLYWVYFLFSENVTITAALTFQGQTLTVQISPQKKGVYCMQFLKDDSGVYPVHNVEFAT